MRIESKGYTVLDLEKSNIIVEPEMRIIGSAKKSLAVQFMK